MEDPEYIGHKKALAIIIILAILLSSLGILIGKVYGAGYGEASGSLGQFVDDYINYDNVQTRHDTVRNTSLNCMELAYTGGIPLYQNFSDATWIENDPAAILTQNVSKSEWSGLLRTQDQTYLYKDMTKLEDWYHEFELNVSSLDKTAVQHYRLSVLSYGNATNDWDWYRDNDEDGLFIFLRTNDVLNEYWGLIYEVNNENNTSLRISNGTKTVWLVFDLHTEYYFTVNKTGSTMQVYVYSDSARTIQIGNSTKALEDVHYSRYVLSPQSLNYAAGAHRSTGYVQNLWFGDIVGGYEMTGVFYTTQVLDGLNGAGLVDLFNVSLDGQTITVEHSPDNSTWVDHEGNAGSDTLLEGFEALDTRDLNYSTEYLRFNLSTVDNTKTPRLFQLRIVTTRDGAAAAGFVINQELWIFGLILAALVFFGYRFNSSVFFAFAATVAIAYMFRILVSGFSLLIAVFLLILGIYFIYESLNRL